MPPYLLISGEVLYGGLGAVVLGVVAGTWSRLLGSAFVWVGLVLALASAVPIHPVAYAILLLSGAAWQFSSTRNRVVKRQMAAALLVAVAVVLGTALRNRADSSFTVPRDWKVFVIGDSLSAGLGMTKEGTWPH